jgi:hypothetical protein
MDDENTIKPSRIGTILSQGAALGEQQASTDALPL